MEGYRLVSLNMPQLAIFLKAPATGKHFFLAPTPASAQGGSILLNTATTTSKIITA
jgi:hypothetical protein